MNKLIHKCLDWWYLARETKEVKEYSSQLEEDTGFSIEIGRNEDGIRCYWLLDPYGDRESTDYWLSFFDMKFDLSDFEKSHCLEHLPS